MSHLIGVSTAATQTSTQLPEGRAFGLGDRHIDHVGNEWVYVSANAAVTAFDTVWVSDTYGIDAITPALGITAGFVGFAQVAFASGDRGWVMARGKPTLRVAASCAKNVPLFTTDTAGVLDDATASASHRNVAGVVLVTTNGASLSTGAAIANFPTVRFTLVFP